MSTGRQIPFLAVQRQHSIEVEDLLRKMLNTGEKEYHLIISELHWKAGTPFAKGLDIEFRGPLTYLTGRQGIGKTTLLRAISGRRHVFSSDVLDFGPSGRPHHSIILHIETEFDCPHVAEPPKRFDIEELLYLHDQARQSHGQVMSSLLRAVSSFEGRLILIDEPENGLSMESVLMLRNVFTKSARKNQLIISTHHPFFIAHKGAFVYDLHKMEEHM